MKTLLKTLFAFCSVMYFSSCTDVVQIKLDEGSKLYVVDAFVNDLRQDQKIRVVTNDSYFSNREAPAITNAVVVLKDLTANKAYSFTYTDNGYYVYHLNATDTISKVGHQYELNINIDGDVYTALTTQKRTARIDSISCGITKGRNGPGPPPQNAVDTYSCELHAKDKTDSNTDYYWIKTYRNDTLFTASSDINICIDGTGGPVSDNTVDSTEFTPVATLLGFKRYVKGNTCKVEIHSISRETYFFFVQAFNQINNSGLFATTPENVKTNIVTAKGIKTKAVGWFNMATVDSRTKVIQ